MLASELLTQLKKRRLPVLGLIPCVGKKCILKIVVDFFFHQWRCSNCDLCPPPLPGVRVYSQCASTTSRGTVSSGKLTARRVREAVSSSSSSSSLSRSAALWPMAAHRRHFLFHTSGDVTWEHTQKKHAFAA